MVKLFTKTFSLVVTALCVIVSSAYAQSLQVAVAANLQPVMKALKKDFKQRTNVDIDVISGSSGKLAVQIRNGAPYDVFLSADTDFPRTLQQDGLTLNSPAVYARGILIICSVENTGLANWPKILTASPVKKIALGNPAIAPYGKAAQQALIRAGVFETVKPKLVFGESISQVNTYITTGVVQAGFTTLSLVKEGNGKRKLFYSVIDQQNYAPIEQAIVLLKHSAQNPAAKKFYQYILSGPAKKIFEVYGYQTFN